MLQGANPHLAGGFGNHLPVALLRSRVSFVEESFDAALYSFAHSSQKRTCCTFNENRGWRMSEADDHERVPAFYMNSVVVTFGPFDFTLTLKVQGADGDQIVARVLTSPQHMKSLARVLTENVARYEEAFMPLPERGELQERGKRYMEEHPEEVTPDVPSEPEPPSSQSRSARKR